eukprot:TRINITY_DN8939_c0_g1_i1.p1 TRINITY_DN8939_c0_g1~~TRINITY_DN8939_c0_g1_i1.p1  ORF type:complete len:363 (+),score=56.44 TRINITY_DN8939_c0_g1_i1:43-1089(+)
MESVHRWFFARAQRGGDGRERSTVMLFTFLLLCSLSLLFDAASAQEDAHLCYPATQPTKFTSSLEGWGLLSGCGSDGNLIDPNLVSYSSGSLSITTQYRATSLCGLLAAYGEIKTIHGYCPGSFSVTFKAAASPGMVNGVLEITRASDGFAVGISITGATTTSVTLYRTIAGMLQYEVVNLPFDASTDFHSYGITWDYTSVTYFVDEEPVKSISVGNFFLTGPSNVLLNLYPTPGYQGSATAYWKSVQFGNDYQIDTPYGDFKVSKIGLATILSFGASPAVKSGGVYRVYYSFAPLKGDTPTWVQLGTSTTTSINIEQLPTGIAYLFRVRAEVGVSVSNWLISDKIQL